MNLTDTARKLRLINPPVVPAAPGRQFGGIYQGAHDDYPGSAWAALIVSPEGLFVSSLPRGKGRKAVPSQRLVTVPWPEVQSIEVDGERTKDVSGGMIMGVGKVTIHNAIQTAVIIRTAKGNIVFSVQGVPTHEVRAGLALYQR